MKKNANPERANGSKGAMPATTRLRQTRVAKKSEIGHLIRAGILTETAYDLETTSLDKNFAIIRSFGHFTADIAGNPLEEGEVLGAIPDHAVISPIAAVVAKVDPRERGQGDPPHIVAGKIAETFNNLSDFNRALFRDRLLDLCEPVTVTVRGQKIREWDYFIEDEKGALEPVRIHADYKHISYLDEKGVPQRTPLRNLKYGHNVTNADDRWIWSALHRANSPDLFITHLRQYNSQRFDTLRAARIFHLFGPQGEEGLKAGDPISFRLSKLMTANTRLPDDARRLGPGVLMPDGTHFDPAGAHGALYDAKSTAGLKRFMRQVSPELMQLLERNCDLKTVTNFLMSHPEGFGERPIIGFGRITYARDKGLMRPILTRHMGVAIDTDDKHGDRKRAIIFNLNVDPDTPKADGKTLRQRDEDELVKIMSQNVEDSEAPFRVLELRKQPPVVSKDMAIAAGTGEGLSLEEIERRRRAILADREFRERIMRAYERTTPPPPPIEKVEVPQPEEELFRTVGPFRYQAVVGKDGKRQLLPDNVRFHAEDAWVQANRITGVIKSVLQPDPVEWRDDFETTSIFHAAMKKAGKDLARYQQGRPDPVTLPPLPKKEFSSTETARDWLWSARLRLMGRAEDLTQRFRLIDRHNHEIPMQDVIKAQDWDLIQRLQSGQWRVGAFERVDATLPLTALMFFTSGRGEALGPGWKEWHEAFCALRWNGPPNQQSTEHRWQSAPRSLRELEQLQNNAVPDSLRKAGPDEEGLWERFLAPEPDREPMLPALAAYYAEGLKKHSFLPASREMMGYDGKTNRPIENIRYPVSRASNIIIDVPHAHLMNPLSDRAIAHRFVIVPGMDKIKEGASLCLRDAELGALYLAAKPVLLEPPGRSTRNRELYEKAESDYAATGHVLPEKMTVIAFEGPYPIAHLRAVDESAQTLRLPSRLFHATISPDLGRVDRVTTVAAVKDDNLAFTPGPARLQEVDAEGLPTGFELEATITSAERLSLEQIKKRTSNRAALAFGFGTRHDLASHLANQYSAKQMKPAHGMFWVLNFKPVDRAGMVWFAPDVIPKAAMTPAPRARKRNPSPPSHSQP